VLIDNGGETGKFFGWTAVLMERLYDDEFGESISQIIARDVASFQTRQAGIQKLFCGRLRGWWFHWWWYAVAVYGAEKFLKNRC
jgi:hypothetical protein